MVFVAGQEYNDSITFQLNESVEILSLTAQELKYYEFDRGLLVLFIEEAVMKGDPDHLFFNTFPAFMAPAEYVDAWFRDRHECEYDH